MSSSQQPSTSEQQQQQLKHQQNLIQHWDLLSPLSDLEKQSIHSIQKASNDKPLPSSISLRNQSLNNLNHTQLSPPSSTRSNSPSSSLRRLINHSKPLEHHQPISSIDRFNDWFSTISSQIEADSESAYLNHLSVLSTYSEACDLLDQAIDDCRACLNEIEANWKFVNENSKSLERSCQGMLDDQKVLGSIATALNDRLAYFRRLDESQRVLSRPGEAEIVNSQEFLPMIERLDVCLEFMKVNRHFRDADLYLVRFQQCLTRSMTLIKLYYTNQMKNLSRQVQEKLQINQQSSSNLKIQDTLLYAKFQTLSEELRPLISQVEKRYLFDQDEYGALLSEFFSTWVSVRSQLLHARIKIEISRIQITHQQVPDLISLATTGCNYMRSVCTAEWNLFKSFFPKTGEEELFVYLESLCDYLYDLLRPQILHEQKLYLLCDLATISNALIAMDSNLIEANQSQFKFSTLLKPVLQDIQTRLVFRAQSIIQSEVANYLPKSEDLDYPNKLIQADQKRQQSGQKSKRFNNPHPTLLDRPHAPLKSRLPAEGVQENWYPTLRKTLWVLSRLHTYVNDAIFEDFAGEAVGICSESIIKASNMMNSVVTQQAGSTTPAMSSKIQANSIDRELFVIRHLLILKEMIRTLDVVQVERAVDLGPITDVLKEILNPSFKDSLIFKPITLMNKLKNLNHSQIEFSKRMGYSSQKDQDSSNPAEPNLSLNFDMLDAQITKTIDSKSEVDLKLKTICHQFIIKSSALICSNSLEPFLTKCQNHLNLEASMVPPSSAADPLGGGGGGGNSNLNRNLGDQEWASQDNVLAVFQAFLKDLQLGLNIIFNRVALYFHDDDHHDFNLINVLFPSLQEEIMEKYRRFYSLIKFEFDFNFINDDQISKDKDQDPEQEIDYESLNQAQSRVLAPSQLHSLIQKIVYRQSSSL
ncbi:uncharacterized protein PGTG_09642 [Puccinia graminis f. sp. tritici CRL 75-36-700-3]|uniref:Conserved oligomeric Golgi complex subunit 3 n=1 Tax=Puccinia graminis f. sp. tritici (strain CRL 75-36-700-3 / race SCCL) TaxID=418459 RepID=E3KI04_PUCGT|nr:uncharacterized protein PGTG_09642 [Puccinia graminis f. sp. tritici CRL 75-36-700-3]EFP83929.1 hypothetical protein PGTG_09642 [Puccinia graminis f. sp. tritici CRL 75-36-700-3]